MPPAITNNKARSKEAQRSSSRTTTPLSSGTSASVRPEDEYTEYLQTPIASLMIAPNNPYDELLDRVATTSDIPGAAQLSTFVDELKRLNHLAKLRSEACDYGMRELAKRRKERIKQEREQEAAEREAEQKREELRKAQERKEQDQKRPPAVGARGLARQDGLETKDDIFPEPLAEDATEFPASISAHQPSPAPTIPQYQIFGADPSTFNDPTIYHIREVTSGMSEEEKKKVLGVTAYPASDLHELTAGTPPDRDFSNAKPATQVNFSSFSNAVEPYIRPLTEEDSAFLQERGDRTTPFMIPRRGTRFYKEVWAEEDGSISFENDQSRPHHSTNQPRGSADDMTDELTSTDEVSAGPLLSRLLATLRSDPRPPSNDVNGIVNGVDEPTTNGVGDAMDVDGEQTGEHAIHHVPSATSMPESNQPGWKGAASKLDYAQMDERLKAELKYIGIISDDDPAPDFDGHFDDEVAARLRLLQDRLRDVMVVNGARKARVADLTREKMAQQEWNTITDDLDNQLNQAFSKRNRNMGKGKKNTKRPGVVGLAGNAATGAGISKPTVGEPIRSLMERREQWYTTIGPVVDCGRTRIPKETIFEDESMERFKALERERMDEEVQE